MKVPSRFILCACISATLSVGYAGPDKPETKPVAATKTVRGPALPIKADLKGAKELYLAVNEAGDGIAADWAVWIEPTLIKADGSKLPLTELKPRESKVGWGKMGINERADGQKPVRVEGKEIANSISTHAPSIIVYDLPENVVAFEAQGGIDEGGTKQNTGSTVIFQVYTQRPSAQVMAAQPVQGTGAKPYGFEEAKDHLDEMKVAEGLGVELFAAEPMIQNPTNIDIDHRGRVWAVEAVNYRSSFKQWGELREGGDRVVILEDTNGDGVADKEKTFYQSKELEAPLGICVLPREKGTQVIVSAAPNVWLLTDADGDDQAEKAEILFKVKGNWDHDHQIHSFVFGADGRFYFNFGNESRELLYPDGKTVVDLAGNRVTTDGKPYRQGMVFKCDIDLSKGTVSNVESLAWNFRNNYEVCIDSFGTLWQSDNDDDGNKGVRINYVMEFGNYGYGDELTGAGWRTPRTNIEKEVPLMHWHLNDPGVVPNLLQTGSGSPTGILINEGSALGPKFQNQLIHCDAGPRTTRAYPVTKDGAGYKGEMVDILTSADSWYRPSDVAIAPDGSLFVADWYDPGVGGHNMGDHDKGKIRGRLYRVAAPGSKYATTKVDVNSATGRIAALSSPNLATRYLAWQKLASLGKAAEAELQQVWKSEDPRLRARALPLLAKLEGKAKALAAGLSDPDSDVRVAAVRLCRNLSKVGEFDTSALEENRELMGKLMRDPSPQVRRQIAVALSGAKEIAKLWAILASQHDGKDRWYLEALGIGARGNEDVCLAAWLEMNKGQWNTPAGRDIVWRLRTPKVAEYLAKIIADKSVHEDEKARYFRSFDFLPSGAEKTKALVELVALGQDQLPTVIEAISRLEGIDLNSLPEVKTALGNVLAAVKGKPEFVSLVRDFNLRDQYPSLLELIVKTPSSPEALEAVKLLLGADQASLQQALKGGDAAAMTNALGNSADKRAVPLLLPMVNDTGAALDLRKTAVHALARSTGGVEALLNLARENKFPGELKTTATSALHAVQLPAVKADVAKLFPLPNAAGGKTLPPIAELAKLTGNKERGMEIYAKVESTCVTCHRIGNVGVDFGPGLSEIGSKLPKEALFEAIIEPNAGVSMGFETTQITLKSGDIAMGIVRSDTAGELALAMPGGVVNKYAKADIAKTEKLPLSLMPTGLNQTLSQEDLVDLVEYLVSLKAGK